MKVVIAPDSLKECMSALQVAQAIEAGVRRGAPDAETVLVPMADGGEGTVDALVAATDGETVATEVVGPLGKPVDAVWGMLGDRATAVIEMAAASGLPLVPPQERNPLVASTFGTGELVRAALDRGAKKIIIGIGGSATVDAGAGMAQALGAKLLDDAGESLGPGGGQLDRLARIDLAGLDDRVASLEVLVASDVNNPLLGDDGAARTFGPQKGATPEMVETLESNLRHFADVVERNLGVRVHDVPGAGAAGGLGAGLIVFLDAKLRLGIDIVLDAVGFDQRIAGADLVITGEGMMDWQSAFGKTPIGVAKAAKRQAIPVVAIVGALGKDRSRVLDAGIDAYFAIADGPITLEQSMARAAELLAETAEQAVRTFLLGG